MSLKHTILRLFVPLALVALLAAACGTPASTSTGSGAPTATATPTTAPTTASNALIATASATVQGKSVTILTNAQGLTLYYRTSDTATSVCTGGCAQAWPPLLSTGSGNPSSSTALAGTLSVSNNANGAQVEYQGHPLYTYAADTAPGQINGENVQGVWFVATTDLKAASGGSAPAATATPGGYGY
jgi:predicted lipoprotein with Yx(FWY)xxD motif